MSDLATLEPFIAEFVAGMKFKLRLNAHKATPTEDSIPIILNKLVCELVEFEEQWYSEPDDPNLARELWDAANFALLAYVALRQRGYPAEELSNA